MKTSDLRWLLLVLVGALAGRAEEKRTPAWESTQWTQIEAALGQVNLDGTLRLSFSLGASIALKQLGIRFELEHRIETDADGRARSEWRVRGLQSSLAPVGPTQLRWQPLAGASVKFDRAKIGRRLADAGSARWLIRESVPGEYEIRSLDGRAWRYRQGVLVSAEHPALGQLRFSTQGAWITQIEQTDTPAGKPPLLQARYDDCGRLVSWQAGAGKSQQPTWDEDGHLSAWRRADGSEVRFAYRANLLGEIIESGKPPQLFIWRENPGYGRGDSRWAAPVHLASDGAASYSCKLTSKGLVLQRTELAGEAVTTTTFNPRRRRLSQETGGFNFLVVFRRGGGGTTLDRIEIGGEVIEKYVHDEQGRLVSIQRHGEAERTLSYDEAGRLMALEEKP
ncbi:MAG: hypothetical protein ACOZE5_08730 [Verrucomicrobiota bacterium]